jgi:predicted nuclease of restriction endonuclease-like (RecB) superfamily
MFASRIERNAPSSSRHRDGLIVSKLDGLFAHDENGTSGRQAVVILYAGRASVMARKKQNRSADSGRRALGRKRDRALFPAPGPHAGLPSDYRDLLAEIKQRIQGERLRTVMAANAGMVLLYWDIGQLILERQDREGWGARVIDRLSADLRQTFPDMSGLSSRNLKYMRAFAAAWPDRAIVQRVVAQLPWGTNMRSYPQALCYPGRFQAGMPIATRFCRTAPGVRPSCRAS